MRVIGREKENENEVAEEEVCFVVIFDVVVVVRCFDRKRIARQHEGKIVGKFDWKNVHKMLCVCISVCEWCWGMNASSSLLHFSSWLFVYRIINILKIYSSFYFICP
jgi:hypothetical protein